MNKLGRKLSILSLSLIAAIHMCSATMDTGLGAGNGGAVINTTTGGFVDLETGVNSATLNFNGDTHVNWNTLNVNGNETLNFNAVDGANGITVLNTVNNGMSQIYGQINANGGVGKLIISNPNGVLFDGAKFTTAGDALITTQAMDMSFGGCCTDGRLIYGEQTTNYVPNGENYVITVLNSDFSVGGEINFVAPTMKVANSAFKTADGAGNVRFTTTNGKDYFITTNTDCNGCTDVNYKETQSMKLEAINVDGNVYIVNDKGLVETANGGNISGNLDVQSVGSVALNFYNNGNTLNVGGDVNAKANSTALYARNMNIGGNLNMKNGGGFLEVNNVTVGKDMNLTTVMESQNPKGYKHFVHVIGDTTVGGNATINSENNIHIGNYDFEDRELLPGDFNVGGTLTAHAKDGHVMTTINVNADKINYVSDNYNILASENATLTANEYSFKSNGYIGAIKDGERQDGSVYSAKDQIIDIMEGYKYIPHTIASHAYMNIAGGHITNIETPTDGAQTYISSNGDVLLTGANAGDINLTAFRKKIEITGPDVHANNINIGNETDYLKLDFEKRDFTTNFTSIRDERVVTIKPDDEITYELADGGYNLPTLKPGEKTTYLIGPEGEKPVEPNDPDPIEPDKPIIPDPEKPKKPSNDDNVKVIRNVPDNLMAAQPGTPVAFAADLDDDQEDAGVRKNVDGSVTVVRAFPME